MVTKDVAVITASFPMVTPGAKNACAPTHAPSPTTMGPLR